MNPKRPAASRIFRALPCGRLSGWRSLLPVGSLLLGLHLPAAALAASIPALPGTAAPAAASATKAPGDDDVSALLDSARREAAQVEQSPNYALNAPATVPDDELKLRRYYLRETVRSYETVVRNLKQQSELRLQLDDAKRLADTWTALDTPPPYSVLVADGLSQEASLARARLKTLRSRQDLVGELRDSISSAAKVAAATVRQLEEQLANTPEARKAGVAWSLEMARHRLRAQSAIIRSLEVADENNQLGAAIAQLETSLAQRKADSVAGRIEFSAADHARIDADLAAESNAMSERLTRALDNAAAAVERLDLARQALQQAQASHATQQSPSGAPAAAAAAALRPVPLDQLRQDVTLAEQRLTTANVVLDALRYGPTILEMKRSLWEYRYRLYREQKAPELLAEVKQRLAGFSSALTLIVRINERQVATALAETLALEKQLATADAATDAPLVQWQLADLAAREDQLRFLSAFVSSARTLLTTVEGELGGRLTVASLSDRLTGLSIEAGVTARGLWNYELFIAEDTIEVDGKKVTGYSSITVGKVLRAILFFSVGVLLSLWLARLSEKIVVHRFKYDAARARILKRWALSVIFIILLLNALSMVRIPLTAFAFLGGAIAIGLGFGTQTLLKNLISGLMMLVERPFKPGDTVEGGGLRGTVVDMNVRAAVLRDINGIETLVPNATFLEQNVTNWTYSSNIVRLGVKVGVAYGSDVRLVAKVLEEDVLRHGQTLKDNKPEILLENFGPDALEFGVYYWIDIGAGTVGRQVASDLRFMIEASLRKNGVAIAFPQRDLHVDMSGPIKVQLQSEGDEPAAAPARNE